RLEDELDDAVRAGDGGRAARCRTALADLDSAAIGTLHSFAQRILTEHPVEAGLPPRIEVLDEVASAVAFDERWSRFLDRLLDDHAPAGPADVAPGDHGLAALLDEVDALVAMRDHCVDESDRFYDQLGRFEVWARRVRQAPDDVARLALLREEAGRPRRKPNGQKGNWPTCELGELKQRYTDLQAKLDALRDRIAHEAVRRLAVELRRFTLEAAAERRDAGELEFHDLLVLARHVLRDPTHGPAVRRALHRRYRH